MLYLDSPIGPINGLMIYRDHQDPDMFYYVPERPRLALNDGTPEFVFLKYRRDITDNADFDPDKDESLGGGFGGGGFGGFGGGSFGGGGASGGW